MQYNMESWNQKCWMCGHVNLFILFQDEIQDGELEVTNEMANRMSLFYAQATPMLKTLSDITSQFVSQVS